MRMQGGKGDGLMMMPDLDEQQFARWATLLEKRLGISVTPQRKGFLSAKLRMRMRELDIANFQDYYELVTSAQQGQMEWSYLLDRLTIHETRFNRHPASFRLIEECYLPKQLKLHSGEVLNLKAWSVGCASGEEAYYLAMVLDRELAVHQGKAYYGVIGSDVSLESLAIARGGEYPEFHLDELDEAIKRSYFERSPNGYRIVDGLRQRVAFSQLNVQKLEQAPFDKVDIIFCQNLLIYFSQERRRGIVTTLARFLKPGGIMILGIGEIVGWCAEGLEPLKFEDTLAYRKVKD
ncbi:MAG: CheR family methyltransferase [Pseudomonadota bacterium]